MLDFAKVGMKITEYRKINQMSQEELAEKLFVSRQLISKWENGIGVPSIDSVIDLSKVLGISIEELLCLNEKTQVDMNDVFGNRKREDVINGIISKRFRVDIPEIFYQLSSEERLLILRAIKNDILKCNLEELYPRLTVAEQKFFDLKIRIKYL